MLRVFLLLAVTSAAWAQASGTIAGMVTDPVDAVIPNAQVILYSSGVKVGQALTDKWGEFRIDSLRPGDYRITIADAGFELRTIENVRVEAGSVIFLGSIALKLAQLQPCPPVPTLPQVRLERAPAGTVAAIQGQVVDDADIPIAGVEIVLTPGSKVRILSGADGKFTIPNVPEGIYTLRASLASHADFIVRRVSVRRGFATRIEPELVMKRCPSTGLCRAVFMTEMWQICL